MKILRFIISNNLCVEELRVEDKKEYTAREVAKEILERAKQLAQSALEKSEDKMAKSDPRNQTSAQMAELNVPQPKAPQAQEKVIAKQPLQLKKFMDNVAMKKSQGGNVFPKEGGAYRQGKIGHDKSRHANEKGVNPMSAAAAMKVSDSSFDQGTSTQRFSGKEGAKKKLEELKDMPKPNLPKEDKKD